jgi:uncharacterized protein (TIRG00374 family)
MEQPKKKKTYWNLIFLVLIIGATGYLVFRDHSLDEVWRDVTSVNPFWLSMSALASLFSSFLLGLALYISFRLLCGRQVTLSKSIGYSLVGSYYSAITPSSTGGQPMQLYHMCADGINPSFASLALLLVNVAYQLVVLLIPAVLSIFRFHLIMDNLGGFRWLLLLGVLISLAWVLFLSFAMFNQAFAKKISYWGVSLLVRMKIIKDREKAIASVDRFLDAYRAGAAAFLKNPRILIWVVLIYTAQMCAQFSISYFVYRSFGLHQYGILDFLALQSVLYIAVCFLPLPGAAGATESAFLSLYQVVFPSGLIVSAMLLSRLVSFYLILLISAIVSIVMQLKLTRKKA